MEDKDLIDVLDKIRESLEKNLSEISEKLGRIENELSALSSKN